MISAAVLWMAVMPQYALARGDVWEFAVAQEFVPMSGSTDEKHVFEYRVVLKALESGDKGLSLEASRILTGEVFDGTRLPPPKDGKPLLEKLALGQEGMFDFEYQRYSDPAEFRISRLVWIVPPKEAKLSWKREWPTIEPDWAPAAEMMFEMPDKQPSPEKVNYHVRFKEFGIGSRIQGEGRAVFERKTMRLVGLEGSFRNVPMPGGEGLHTLKLKVNRL